MATPLRALLIEDSENDAYLLLRELARIGYSVTHQRVETASATEEAFQSSRWDIVFTDYSMPGYSAVEALSIYRRMGRDVPFVVVSGTIGEETAVEVMKAGAHDFLIKGHLARLLPIVQREMREAELRRARLEERDRADAERERLLRELQQAVAARDAFLSIASHELKTPLTSLQLQVQSLQRWERRENPFVMPPYRLEAKLSVIGRQVSRLGTLVNNLLEVTRITSERMTLARELFDLSFVIKDVVAQSQELLRQCGSDVIVDTDQVVGPFDRVRIESVITNLLSNAIKFGEGKPIHVTLRTAGDQAILSVQDQGIGISAKSQSSLFEKFERAVPAQHYGGFGLGLWIVRQIVEAHGGRIRVESGMGEGSTFTVMLPLTIDEVS